MNRRKIKFFDNLLFDLHKRLENLRSKVQKKQRKTTREKY